MSPIKGELLAKYIQGKCSPEAAAAILHWLDDNDLEDYSEEMKPQRKDKKIDKSLLPLTAKVDEGSHYHHGIYCFGFGNFR